MIYTQQTNKTDSDFPIHCCQYVVRKKQNWLSDPNEKDTSTPLVHFIIYTFHWTITILDQQCKLPSIGGDFTILLVW